MPCADNTLYSQTQFRIRDKLRSLLQEYNYDFYTCQGTNISCKILAERKQELEKVINGTASCADGLWARNREREIA